MKLPLIFASVVCWMAGVASVASAEPKGYLQGGLIVTAQPAGTANHRVTPAISGTTVGVAASAGFFISRTVAIEGEFAAGPPISTRQRFSYDWFEEFTGESRDVFLGANVRWRRAAHFELAGGGGLAFSTFAERSIVRT